MDKIKKVRYATKERLSKVNPDNVKVYDKYLKSSIIKNKEMESSTYSSYRSYFNQFLVYLMEDWDNINLYSEEFMTDAVDIMEGFIGFCQDTLFNHKKVINTKISAVSSFYLWSMKRGLVDKHPFDKKLDRMKGANEEKVLDSHFLTDDETVAIRRVLMTKNFDIQDEILFELALDSANRLGAIHALSLSKLDLENNMFTDIREKRGYRVEVVFSDKTKEIIEEWLDERKEDYDKLEVDSLFVTLHDGEHKQMSKGTIQYRMKKLASAVGIENFYFHCLRKSSLNNIYNETGDISLAQQLANHKDISTTFAHYVKPKSKKEVLAKIKELREKRD